MILRPRRRFGLLSAAALVFATMTGIMTAPLSWQFADHLVPETDSYLHVWVLAWTAHQLAADPAQLFNANIFYPTPGTLAFSDAFPLLGLVGAPFIWAGVHPVAVHNALLLASFVAAGVGMFVLAFELTGAMAASLLAGTIFTFASQRFAHIAHLELLWTCWMPLALWALHRVAKHGRARDGAWLGLLVAIQGLSSLYYLVFICTFLGVAALASIDRAPLDVWKRRLTALTLAAVVAAVLLGPYLMAYARLRTEHRTRTDAEVERYSATAQTYLRVVPENRAYFFLRRYIDDQERSLFPGALAIALAAFGIVKGPRREAGIYVAGLIFAYIMSLGMNGPLFPVLRELVPPLRDIRAPARYSVLVLMSIAVLAAFGASRVLTDRLRAKTLVTAGLFAVALLEYASMPVETFRPVMKPPQMARWMADQPPGSVTAFLPMHYWDHDPWYEYLSIYHWQPMLNGYSGFSPPGYRSTAEALTTFPDARSIQRLKDQHVSFVVVSAARYSESEYSTLVQHLRTNPDFDTPVTFDDAAFPGTAFRLRR